MGKFQKKQYLRMFPAVKHSVSKKFCIPDFKISRKKEIYDEK